MLLFEPESIFTKENMPNALQTKKEAHNMVV